VTAVAAVTIVALLAQAVPPRFSSEVELVTLDVVAVDAKGDPVTDLTRDEFVVKENGLTRELVRFESFGGEAPAGVAAGPATEPVADAARRRTAASFALIVDDQGMAQHEMSDTRDALASFVTRIARDGDSITLAATSGSAWWTATVPDGREDLLAIIGRLRGRETEAALAFDYMSDYEAFAIRDREDRELVSRIVARWTASGACSPPVQGRPDPTCPGRVRAAANSVDGVRRSRAQGLLSTVRRTIEGLAASRARKSVILYSRGFLEDTDTPARDVADAARTANAAVYFIDTRGLQLQPGLGGAADAGSVNPSDFGRVGFESRVLESEGAQKLAIETGGFSVRNSNDFSAAGASAARDSRAYYLLGFDAPTDAKPGVWRNLKVEVTRPGVTVRARKGYALRIAPKPAEAMTAALQAAEDARGIPVRARAFAFEARPKKLTRLLVAAEFDASSLRLEGSRPTRLALAIAVVHRDTGAVLESHEDVEVHAASGQASAWRSLAREFDVTPGVSQVRVVLREASAGAIGSATDRVEVPAGDAFRITTPIVTDRAEAKAGDDHPRAALSISRVFRPRGPVFCEFEVLGAKKDPALRAPRVSSGLQVTDASGAVVRNAPPTLIAPDGRGRVIRLIGIGMDGLPEGEYEMRIAVRDEVAGTALERAERFTLRAQ
jgi:VWFA-related protein